MTLPETVWFFPFTSSSARRSAVSRPSEDDAKTDRSLYIHYQAVITIVTDEVIYVISTSIGFVPAT